MTVGFAQVPKDFYTDKRLSIPARLTGVVLIGFQFQDGETHVGQERIAEALGRGVRQTQRYLEELEDAGWVTIERRRKRRGAWETNLYAFVSPGQHHTTSTARGECRTTNKQDANKHLANKALEQNQTTAMSDGSPVGAGVSPTATALQEVAGARVAAPADQNPLEPNPFSPLRHSDQEAPRRTTSMSRGKKWPSHFVYCARDTKCETPLEKFDPEFLTDGYCSFCWRAREQE
jgi:hypothetical protein